MLLKAPGKGTSLIFLLLAAFCLLLPSCGNPLIQQILEYKTVSFNTNGGSFVPAQNLIKGRKVMRPDDPVKPDCIFAGWFSDNGTFDYEWDFDYIPSADLTLHAKWIDFIQFNLQAAVNVYQSAAGDMTIRVPGNLILTENITIPANAGGHTLTITSDGSSPYAIYRGRQDTNPDNGLFIVQNGAKLVFQNIVIDGHYKNYSGTILHDFENNAASLVRVGGSDAQDNTFTLGSGAVLKNNRADYGGGVYVNYKSNFYIDGGTISGNTAAGGGGVYVGGISSVFIMTDGMVWDNQADDGGGVYVTRSGTFNMSGGEVLGNKSVNNGGGVFLLYVYEEGNGSFKMSGSARVSGNTAANGGGVYINNNCILTMSNGVVSGNTASGRGGGVYVVDYYESVGEFKITNGTVYGSNAAGSLANIAASQGAALYVEGNGLAQRGTFNDDDWNSAGDLSTTNYTFRVENGMLLP